MIDSFFANMGISSGVGVVIVSVACVVGLVAVFLVS